MNIFRSSGKKKKLPPLSPTSTLHSTLVDVESGVQQQQKRTPRLDRTKAIRHIDYAEECFASDAANSVNGSLKCRSLDLCVDNSCLKIDGKDDRQVGLVCRSLGLTGPDDFGIPIAAWEVQKARSASDVLPRTGIFDGSCLECSSPPSSSKLSNSGKERESGENDQRRTIPDIFHVSCSASDEVEQESLKSPNLLTDPDDSGGRGGGGGIRGIRPPALSTAPYLPPPPRMCIRVPNESFTGWESVKSLTPHDENNVRVTQQSGRSALPHYNRIEEDEGTVQRMTEEHKNPGFVIPVGGELTGSGSFTTTSNDDDCSSTITEGIYVISPSYRCRPHLEHWCKGRELGRGSYGVVYEAFSEVGDFFAVKEVSLLDQGVDAIEQLEQEICFLSTFEHENIVRYLGTEKGEGKLYIFLELVTQGSLASLYKNYVLWDSQVLLYTRQILNGLKYLHTRNVVHRDIKCANILVTANGSVKLTDFGLAKQTTENGLLRSCKGSVYWMAPEVINPKKDGGYGTAADIWSLGCTVLEMFTRQPPYPDLEWVQAMFKIANGLKPNIPDSLSRDATDFICQCVQVNPNDRPTAQKLLEHPFVRKQLPASLGHGSDSTGHGRRTWTGT